MTATRYDGIIHDFVMLHPLAATQAARAATAQGAAHYIDLGRLGGLEAPLASRALPVRPEENTTVYLDLDAP